MKFSTKALSLLLALVMAASLAVPAIASYNSQPDFGDINTDGNVNIIDVILVFFKQIGFFNPSASGFKNADVNGDGAINSTDRAIIKQKLRGQISEWPLLAKLSVESISIVERPTQTFYLTGESFEPEGMVVVAACKGDIKREIPIADCTITGFSSATEGTKQITVTYEGKSDSFTVEVAKLSVENISIAEQPTKTFYLIGESFDPEGLAVVATYNGGIKRDIPIADCTITGFSSATKGTKQITVAYEGKSASFTVDVSYERIVRYECNYPTKTDYSIGIDTLLSTDGSSYYAVYNTGRREAVSVEYSGFDASATGELQIKVRHLGSEIGSFKIYFASPKLIGSSAQIIETLFGAANRIDSSELGFKWHIYNSDYSKFFMVGIDNGYAVALYYLNDNFDVFGVKSGITKSDFAEKFPGASVSDNYAYFPKTVNSRDISCSVFFDQHNSDKCFALLAIDKAYSSRAYSNEVMRNYEFEILDMTNAFRVMHGLSALRYSEPATLAAREHSSYMAANGICTHTGEGGSSPSDRLSAKGIRWSTVAENVAGGQQNSSFVMNGWVNSSDHRDNLLRTAVTHLGVGATFSSSGRVYYTQDFFSFR